MADEDTTIIANLIKGSKIAIVTTQTSDGALHSRPLATQEAEFDGDLWFFTQDPSPKVEDVKSHPKVNVSFESGKGYLSISGTAEIVHDSARVDEYWSPAVQAWFPEGREDPTIALLKVHADSAEYWESSEPGVVKAFKIAKAAVTGGQPDIGTNQTVEL